MQINKDVRKLAPVICDVIFLNLKQKGVQNATKRKVTKVIDGGRFTTDKTKIFIALLFLVIIAMSTSGCAGYLFRKGAIEGSDQTFSEMSDTLTIPEDGQVRALRLNFYIDERRKAI